MSDYRPENCRFRLQSEGKPYPRSSCKACGKTITTGLGKVCTQRAKPLVMDATIETHTEGFPEGWFVDERESTAILCVKTTFPLHANQAVCLRPRAMDCVDWLPIARQIANAIADSKA